jgi:regulator of protease activity HflC (stomatin/prohibitin superfamily)
MWSDRHVIALTVSGLFLLLILVYYADNIFVTIPPGFGGALWLRFLGGTVLEFHYGEGTKVIPPWDRIYLYDLRVQQEAQHFDVLTKEGLQISVDAVLRFRTNAAALGSITAYAGPDFVHTLIMPSVGATVRAQASKYELDEIYSNRRHEIEDDIQQELSAVVESLLERTVPADKPEVLIEDFWFRSIVLPPELRASIEAKMVQKQLSEQFVIILQREEREKQRKIIEAQGIKSFQDIVSSGISENYLRWKGIDATLKLADSPNAKIVIVGGKDGLPLILGPLTTPGGDVAPGPGAPVPAAKTTPNGDAATLQNNGPAAAARTPDTSGSLVAGPGMPARPLALDQSISQPGAQVLDPLPRTPATH